MKVDLRSGSPAAIPVETSFCVKLGVCKDRASEATAQERRTDMGTSSSADDHSPSPSACTSTCTQAPTGTSNDHSNTNSNGNSSLGKEQQRSEEFPEASVPAVYSARSPWIAEWSRGFVTWWLRTFLFRHTRRIHVEELEGWLNDKASNVLVLDARRPDEYEMSHILGSVNVNALSKKIPDFLKEEDKERSLVIYCAVGLRSGLLEQRLHKKGFKKTYTIIGGFYNWVNKGKPIYRGDPPRVVYNVKPQHIMAALALKPGVRRWRDTEMQPNTQRQAYELTLRENM